MNITDISTVGEMKFFHQQNSFDPDDTLVIDEITDIEYIDIFF